MGGTKEGGKLAAQTNIKKYGEDFYRRIGAEGGRKGRTGGTYGDRVWASKIGSIGGSRSRRGLKLVKVTETELHYTDNRTGEAVKIPRGVGQ